MSLSFISFTVDYLARATFVSKLRLAKKKQIGKVGNNIGMRVGRVSESVFLTIFALDVRHQARSVLGVTIRLKSMDYFLSLNEVLWPVVFSLTLSSTVGE